MTTILSTTNRPHSNTYKVAREYLRHLEGHGEEVLLADLMELPEEVVRPDAYDHPGPAFRAWQERYLFPADKFVFVLPEYNGSIPGILKLMIDTSDIKRAFRGKRALLVGVATGRAGNLRGMDHMTAVLHHMKMTVHHNQLPISKVTDMMDAEGRFLAPTERVVTAQIDEFTRS